jgi:hypothetical protein
MDNIPARCNTAPSQQRQRDVTATCGRISVMWAAACETCAARWALVSVTVAELLQECGMKWKWGLTINPETERCF